MGWPTSWNSNYSRNLNFLCCELNKHIDTINTNMKPTGYPYIDLHFSVEAIKTRGQDLLNQIHHHFELLIGQVWSVSNWYKLAPNEQTRTAIRMLNNYCHEIENVLEGIRHASLIRLINFFGIDVHSLLLINLGMNGVDSQGQYFSHKELHYLTEEEFGCFQKSTQWGDVSLYYAQLGKSHMDAFRDRDQFIDRENISSHQIVTGEAVFSFGDLCISKEFKAWCQQHDFEWTDPKLGIGFPVVAQIENPYPKRYQLINELRLRNDIYCVSVEESDATVTRVFDYTWQDEEQWKNNIKEELI
jgi:hypothetical protein